ncbi:hypothetical protein ACTXM3_13255 [Glutamicibacter arilaitensis]|uniref:Uncharacterized protein n=3 Tax=Glutamicibacter arilaitensis TaxID=256701 RepID=A0A2N7S1G1_9MICC|nr:hypothetical protein [Glutamicibacter arilaitensis]PMQ19974.1 hypothetical protein CIK84_15255 [Glutamicibacter arilaitensis]
MTIIDPQKVPAFPVYTLKISEGRESLTLDGAQIPVLDGEDFIEAGKNAIVAKLTSHNLGMVRARAIDESSGQAWDMIIAATGEVLDLTEQQEAEQAAKARKQRRNKRLMIAGVSTLAVLTLGGLGTAVVIANQPAATVPAYTPQGVGATLPAAPPPQHSATAAWSHPTLADATVNMISPDRLLTADPEGTVTGRHPSTGQPVWRGDKAPEDLASIHQGTWAGKPVYAVAERNELRLWPVEMPYDTPSVAPTSIGLEPGQTARTDTHTPYIELGDWYIRVPDAAGTLHDVMIPPGSTVLDVAADGTITTISSNTIYTLDNSGKILEEKNFTAPEGATKYPVRVWLLDDTHALLAWDDTERVMGVLNTSTGSMLFSGTPRAIPTATEPLLVDREAKTAAIGSVGISYGDQAALIDLPAADLSAIHGNLIYANSSNGPVTLDLGNPEAEPQSWANYRAEDPAPALVTDDAVYLVATQLDNTTVYRSNREQ